MGSWSPPSTKGPWVAGVDGCRGGWVVAALATGGDGPAPAEVAVSASVAPVIDAVRRGALTVVAVDMPIGLPERGRRGSDAAVRAELGPRRASLFPTPVRAVLDAIDLDDAQRRSRAACGRGLSVQTWNLVAAIRELDAAVDPSLFPRVVEAHPETSFTVLGGGPRPEPKRTTTGRDDRARLLGGVVADVESLVAARPPGCADHDVLDALAAAWTARRVARGEARWLGDPDERDARGLSMVVAV